MFMPFWYGPVEERSPANRQVGGSKPTRTKLTIFVKGYLISLAMTLMISTPGETVLNSQLNNFFNKLRQWHQ